MRLNEIVFTDARPVEGYGPGFFRIGGEVIKGAVIAASTGTCTWEGFGDVEALLALVPHSDVIFMGTGAEIAHLPPGLRARLEEAGVGVEAMSSPAAARTYNVLLSEGRRVSLAMLPV